MSRMKSMHTKRKERKRYSIVSGNKDTFRYLRLKITVAVDVFAHVITDIKYGLNCFKIRKTHM